MAAPQPIAFNTGLNSNCLDYLLVALLLIFRFPSGWSRGRSSSCHFYITSSDNLNCCRSPRATSSFFLSSFFFFFFFWHLPYFIISLYGRKFGLDLTLSAFFTCYMNLACRVLTFDISSWIDCFGILGTYRSCILLAMLEREQFFF